MTTLEFAVAPADVPALSRFPCLHRIGRATAVQLLLHDTPSGELAGRALTACQEQGLWRIEALQPGPAPWPPATPTPVLAEAATPRLLDLDTATLVPIAAFNGHRRRYVVEGDVPVQLAVLSGALRGVAAELPVCRVTLHGPGPAVHACATAIARLIHLTVPRAGLGAQAVAVARGQDVPARHLGAPVVVPGQALTDSIALIVGQLLDVMLYWSGPACAGATPLAVHQMRVATRRLRSALSIFKHVAPCGPTTALAPALRDLATCLGSARDWDVFLGGTGAQIQTLFPDDRRVRTLLASAARHREGAYVALRAYLTGPVFRELEVALGCTAALRPWDDAQPVTQPSTQPAPQPGPSQPGPPQPGPLQQDTSVFATAILTRRHRRVQKAGRHIRTLPVVALHELRKDCKRLRYAAEFFQPLFPDKPGRKFIRKLAALQEELGMLNDGAVASGLMSHLGRIERSYAAGLVGGFVAANSEHLRSGIGEAWHRFRASPAFWHPPA